MSVASTALAFASSPPGASALSGLIGALVFVAVVAFAAAMIVQRDRWRAFWFEREDPRSIGAFRVVFGLLLLANVHGLADHFEFLFTDEGIFSTSTARDFLARRQFAGYGDPGSGDPEGFFDLWAIGRFASGPKWSALFFWDSPRAFWIHFWVFEILVWLFIFGVFSRVTGWLAYFATLSLMHRNALFWTGADVVFKVFFAWLVMAKNGHAYSFDNWWRVRRARAKGQTVEAVYRAIPAWPRRLMILQLCIIYLWTGSAKSGSVWSAGDSLYYALNLDHFSRVPTSFMASIFGTNLFRLMTWVVHFWQIGFSLMFLGLVLRWTHRRGIELAPRQRRWLRAALLVFATSALGVAIAVVPIYHHPRAPLPLWAVQAIIAASGGLVIGTIAWAWPKLRRGDWSLRIAGRRHVIDVPFVARWLFGRRVWLLLGAIFHLQILTLMNIGMFAPVMLAAYIACLNGGEVGALLSGLGRALSRLLPTRWRHSLQGPLELHAPERPTAAESSSSPRDQGLVGPTLALIALLAVSSTTLLCVYGVEGWSLPVLGLFVGLLILGRRRRRRVEGTTPGRLAYGPLERVVVGSFLVAELCALFAWSIPAGKAELASWRTPLRRAVHPLLRVTNTEQSWNMFAPNPPRVNSFLRVLITDAEGEVWDMMTDANSPRLKETPWIAYSRAGKITRRVMGNDGKAYRKHYARHWCRQWELEHGGEPPLRVELVRDSYRIPKPGSPAWDPAQMLAERGKHVAFHTEHCLRAVDGRLSNEVRARHGLPPVDERELRTRTIKRWDRWQRRDEAKKKPEVKAAKAPPVRRPAKGPLAQPSK